jgi:hypothetical protein
MKIFLKTIYQNCGKNIIFISLGVADTIAVGSKINDDKIFKIFDMRC